jgi:hypothetical protein
MRQLAFRESRASGHQRTEGNRAEDVPERGYVPLNAFQKRKTTKQNSIRIINQNTAGSSSRRRAPP